MAAIPVNIVVTVSAAHRMVRLARLALQSSFIYLIPRTVSLLMDTPPDAPRHRAEREVKLASIEGLEIGGRKTTTRPKKI